MRVKIANPELAAGLVDPHTKRRPFLDPEGRPILDAIDVPDTSHWARRVRDGSIVRVAAATAAEPSGAEPIPPLTTRERR